MRPVLAVVALLALLLGLLLALVPTTAQAAEDTITDLVVNYDIGSDGSVAVRHELQWRFGSEGRHGIDFSIATRESWDADTTMDVLYDITDVTVASPSGAPDSFTQTETEYGSIGSLDLRIGDPAETVDGRDASYVISYTLRGGLRTFDGIPEFHWDVTGDDYPDIKKFTVNVTAPEGVQKARCLVGNQECGAQLNTDATAVLTGGDVPSGTVVTAVAGLGPGTVADAQPTLAERKVDSPVMTGITSAVEVTGDGVTHVEQEMTYLLPDDGSTPTLRWSLPIRRPFSTTQDQVFHVTNVEVEGAAEVVESPLSDRDRSEAHQDMELRVVPENPERTITLTLTYEVTGAVTTEGDTAHARWLLTPVGLREADVIDFTWHLPAEVTTVACTTFQSHVDEHRECVPHPVLNSDGETVSWIRHGEGPMAPPDAWIGSEVSAASVGHAAPILERGIEVTKNVRMALGVVAGVAALVGAAGALVLLARIRVRSDTRWADVAPGLTAPAGAPVRPARRSDVVPVRFDKPDCSLALAGLVLDGRPSPRHTAALLVHMAVIGAVKVQSKPLKVVAITDAPLEEHVEKQLYKAATLDDVALDRAGLQQVGSTVDSRQKALLARHDIFVPLTSEKPVALHRQPVVWGLAALAAVFPLGWLFIPGWLGPHGFLVVAGAVGGGVLGMNRVTRQTQRRSLEPNGTALRDQVQGFRRYIATAEADQLDFEAEHDIYRRYLPWAVLFGLTKRWTRVCQDLAATGRISDLDTSFWIGSLSAGEVAGEMSDLQGPLRAATPSPTPPPSSPSSSGGFFSGGGSGGSSGFSGGSSGGGGGGGTSASSW